MIVEDDLSIADLLQRALEADGYVVTGIARTVKEAVQLSEQNTPDVAIVDLRLADGDLGTSAAAHLRFTTNTKIMFSTENSNGESALSSCGDAVMIKPYRIRDVGQGLRIIDQLARSGQTALPFPRNFRLLTHATASLGP